MRLPNSLFLTVIFLMIKFKRLRWEGIWPEWKMREALQMLTGKKRSLGRSTSATLVSEQRARLEIQAKILSTNPPGGILSRGFRV